MSFASLYVETRRIPFHLLPRKVEDSLKGAIPCSGSTPAHRGFRCTDGSEVWHVIDGNKWYVKEPPDMVLKEMP